MVQANARFARRPRGLTLVEMLVAMTCTVLLMLAITQTFQSIGDITAKGRAGIEMSTQLRGVWLKLQEDLQAVTVPVRPWPDSAGAAGYFEYYDGLTWRDATAQANEYNVYGDVDDILAMTCRTTGEPFVGRYVINNSVTMIQSNVAEVIWFTRFTDKNGNNTLDAGEPVTLYRRVLLVRPDLNGTNGDLAGYTDATYVNFLQQNDISVRRSGGNLVANSLADLTQRENRFAHAVGNYVPATATSAGHFSAFPFPISLTNGFMDQAVVLTGDRTGEDVILSNVIAFDIRVFDRFAHIQNSNGEPVSPGDPGFKSGDPSLAIGQGAYVDLQHAGGSGDFTSVPMTKSLFGNSYPTYDTWSYFYEHDGVNQNGNSLTDEGTDGIDNVGVGTVAGAVDDVEERETSPPYPVPLRGIQIRLRALERDTRQVRQATLVQDFLPE